MYLLGNADGQCKTLVGCCSSAHFVHDDEAAGSGMAKDGGRFFHLQHKCRAITGEVVGGTDSRKHGIDNADGCTLGRDEGSRLGHDGEQGVLSQKRALTAHIRTGDDGKRARGKVARVCHKGVALGAEDAINDRMSAMRDIKVGVIGELWSSVSVAGGHLGIGKCNVNFGNRIGTLLDGPCLCADLHTHHTHSCGQQSMCMPLHTFKRSSSYKLSSQARISMPVFAWVAFNWRSSAVEKRASISVSDSSQK